MLTDSGVAVDVAFLTRGEQGLDVGAPLAPAASRELARVRMHEARAACDVLGVRRVTFLGGCDTQLADQPELSGSIGELLQSDNYQRVFCPWPHDAHDDHKATFTLLRRAAQGLAAATGDWLY